MRVSFRIHLAVVTALLTTALPLRAQPAAPPDAAALFDDGQLQDIKLVVNPRDWADLKADFQLNTYYPAHFIWRDRIVRNVGVRSRGTGSRSGTKPGLR